MERLNANARKLIFKFFSLACLIAIAACVIVDIAMNQQFTWSLYPALSVPFGWLVISPIFTGKYGVPLSLSSVTLFVIPCLYLLEKVTPRDNWFSVLGIPAAVIGIIAMWALYLLFKFLRISLWYKWAAAVFLVGVVVSPLIQHYVDSFLDESPTFFSRFINIAPLVVVSVLLGVIGYRKNRKVPAMD